MKVLRHPVTVHGSFKLAASRLVEFMRSFAQIPFAIVFVYVYIFIDHRHICLYIKYIYIYIFIHMYIVCINVLIGDMIFKRRSMRIPQF